MKHRLLRAFLIPALCLLMPAAYAQSITNVVLGTNPICAGSTLTITFDRSAMPGAATETAQISDINGNFSPVTPIGSYNGGGAQGTISATIPAGTTGGTYQIRIASTFGAGINSASVPITVTPAVSTPVFQAGLPTSLCQAFLPTPFPATASNSTSITYSVSPTPPGTVSVNSSGELAAIATYTGSVVITATASGCGPNKTATHTVAINPSVGAVSFTAGATSSRCQGNGTETYSADAANKTGITYTLTQNPGTPNLNINGSGEINFPNAFVGTVTITAKAAGCNGPTSAIHTVTVGPAATVPAFVPGLPTERCQGVDTIRFNATSSNNTTPITYSVSTTPTLYPVTIDAATGDVRFPALFVGTATVTATTQGCNGTVSNTHEIVVNPGLLGVSFNVGDSVTVCQNSNPIIYGVNALNFTSLNYSILSFPANAQNTVTGLLGLNSQVTFASGFSGYLKVVALGIGCNGLQTDTLVIRVKPTVSAPAFADGGSSARCQQGGTFPYAVTVNNADSVRYSITSVPSAGTASIDPVTGDLSLSNDFFGTVAITARAYGCGGPKTAVHNLTVNGTLGTLAFGASAVTNRCQGAEVISYAITAPNNQGLSYSMTKDRPDINTFINPSSGDVTFSADFAGSVTITATAAGCGGPLDITRTVTIVGKPVFDSGVSTTRCQKYELIRYRATSVNGTITNYSVNPGAPVLGIDAATGVVSFDPDFFGTAVVTATASGCATALQNTHTVNVTARVGHVVFDSGVSSVRCQGAETIRYSAAAPDQDGITYRVTSTPTNSAILINSGTGDVTFPANFSGIVRVTGRATGCGGSRDSSVHTVTVTSTVSQPVFNAGPTSTRCQGADTIIYTATAATSTGITYSVTSNPNTGVSINAATGRVIFDASFAGTATITASAAGCNGPATQTHTVTTTQTVGVPVFDSGTASTRCQGAATIRYGAAATTSTAVRYEIETIPNDNNTTVNPLTGFVTFSAGFAGTAKVKAIAQGCNGPSESIHTITVIATPNFNVGTSFARCQGLGNEIFTAQALNSSAITYSIETTPLDTATKINPTSGLASFSAGFSGVAIVYAKGCALGDSARLTVNVNATPHIYTLSDSICSDSKPSSVLLSTISGSSFTWFLQTPLASNLSKDASPTSGSGSTINNPQLTNSNNRIDDSAYYNVVTTYTAYGKTCSGNDVFTLKVKHKPTVTTQSNFTICSGLNTNIVLTASDTNSTFNWTSPVNRAVTINGNLNNGTTCNLCNTISQVLRDTGINTGIVVYTANATANGCTGSNRNITVTVNPNPVITFPRPNTNFSVCSERPLSITLLDTPGVGTTSFYWSRIDQAGIDVYPAPFGSTIRDSVVNLSRTVTPTPITYTVFDTSFLGCAATPVQFTVTVNPKPELIRMTTAICSEDTANLTLQATTGTGSSFSWVVLSNIGSITGAGSGSGTLIGQRLRNPSFDTAGAIIYGVIPISPAPALCPGVRDTVRIDVNPLPQLRSVSTRTICSDDLFSYNVLSSTGPLSSYTYRRTGTTPSIETMVRDTAMNVSLPIEHVISSNYLLDVHRADYRISLTSPAGCKFNDQPLTVTVNPTPITPGISIAPPANLCRNTIGINLGAGRQPDPRERFTWSSNQTINQLADSTRFALATFNTQGTARVAVVSRAVGFTCTSVETAREFNVSAGTGSNNPNVVFFQNNLVCQGANIVKYQWGFDRRVNYDSVIIEGATYQNLFTGTGSGFDPGANFYWVMATFTDGCTRKAYYNQPSLAAPTVVRSSNAELKLYPNPATNDLTVEFSEAGAKPYTIEVYDVAGRRLHSQDAIGEKSRVNVSTFVPGYYTVICVQEGNRIGSARFIKQ